MTGARLAHSVLGASSCHRWLECPGSIRLSRGIESHSSIFAAEGTAAHWLADQCLRHGREPREFYMCEIPVEGHTFVVEDEMIEAVDVYLDAIKSRAEPGNEIETEVRFELSDLHPDFFGTADCTIYKPKQRKLVVVDLKYGKGVAVQAENNPQLLYYAYGAATKKSNRGVGAVDAVIVQPRCPLPGDVSPGVREWNTDVVQLLDHSADLVAAARRTEEPDAPLNAGDWCKFCPAAAICPERRASVLETIKADFADSGDLHLSDPTKMALADRQKVFAVREQIKDWLKRLDEFEHHEAEAGRCLPGWKLVAKRATRKWLDKDKAALLLENQFDLDAADIMTTPELKSPAQVEKLIPKKVRGGFSDLYESVSSGTVLAPESDPRPAAKAEAAEEFAA